jgi:hypothetical protein
MTAKKRWAGGGRLLLGRLGVRAKDFGMPTGTQVLEQVYNATPAHVPACGAWQALIVVRVGSQCIRSDQDAPACLPTQHSLGHAGDVLQPDLGHHYIHQIQEACFLDDLVP